MSSPNAGVRTPAPKLTDDQRSAYAGTIRRMAADGWSDSKISLNVGITKNQVYAIRADYQILSGRSQMEGTGGAVVLAVMQAEAYCPECGDAVDTDDDIVPAHGYINSRQRVRGVNTGMAVLAAVDCPGSGRMVVTDQAVQRAE